MAGKVKRWMQRMEAASAPWALNDAVRKTVEVFGKTVAGWMPGRPRLQRLCRVAGLAYLGLLAVAALTGIVPLVGLAFLAMIESAGWDLMAGAVVVAAMAPGLALLYLAGLRG
jgi:hypothetical protein